MTLKLHSWYFQWFSFSCCGKHSLCPFLSLVWAIHLGAPKRVLRGLEGPSRRLLSPSIFLFGFSLLPFLLLAFFSPLNTCGLRSVWARVFAHAHASSFSEKVCLRFLDVPDSVSWAGLLYFFPVASFIAVGLMTIKLFWGLPFLCSWLAWLSFV